MVDPKYILLVEDNPDDEELTIRALRKGQIRNPVHVAHDGVEALDFLFCRGEFANRNPNEKPQVILLDLKLPKIDGLEVLRAIRSHEEFKTYPVVVLTSSQEDRDIVESYNLGANSYVCKPVDIDEFYSAVKQLGLYWLLLNERGR